MQEASLVAFAGCWLLASNAGEPGEQLRDKAGQKPSSWPVCCLSQANKRRAVCVCVRVWGMGGTHNS
jgi:hypothetical protein